MRGPDRGSDYRRRLLIETMRGHPLSGHVIRRRLRTRPSVAAVRFPARGENGTADRRHLAQHQLGD